MGCYKVKCGDKLFFSVIVPTIIIPCLLRRLRTEREYKRSLVFTESLQEDWEKMSLLDNLQQETVVKLILFVEN